MERMRIDNLGYLFIYLFIMFESEGSEWWME